MQQIWGYFIDVIIAHACYIYIISLRAQISQNVIYWFEICDVLVPIFHSIKFAKCEICGSTKPKVISLVDNIRHLTKRWHTL